MLRCFKQFSSIIDGNNKKNNYAKIQNDREKRILPWKVFWLLLLLGFEPYRNNDKIYPQ